MVDGNMSAPLYLFSDRGEWLAFVHVDKTVWRPDGFFIGYIIDGDLFDPKGGYIASVTDRGTLFYSAEKSTRLACPPFPSPPVFPGYPGVPAPSLIAPLPSLVTHAAQRTSCP